MSDRWSRLAPLTGVVFGILVVIAFFASGGTPSSHASAAKVAAYYIAHHDSVTATGYGLAYASVFALFFGASLRPRLRGRGSDGLVALGFGGAVTFAVAIGAASGSALALVDHTKSIDPVALQAVNLVGDDMLGPLLQIGMVAYMAGYGLAIVRGAAVPRWLGWLAVALAIFAAVPAIGFFSLLGIVIWSIVLGILLFLRAEPGAAVPGAA